MKITKQILIMGTGCTEALAIRWLPHINEACDRFSINNPSRIACFLANVGVESGGLSTVIEGLNYKASALQGVFGAHRITASQAARFGRTDDHSADQQQIANTVYGGEWGAANLGNTEPGDGWKFRGRGLIQTTGRANYRKTGDALGIDLINDPDQLRTDAAAAASAAYFFKARGCNELSDEIKLSEVVRKINGKTPNVNNHGQLRLDRSRAVRNFMING